MKSSSSSTTNHRNGGNRSDSSRCNNKNSESANRNYKRRDVKYINSKYINNCKKIDHREDDHTIILFKDLPNEMIINILKFLPRSATRSLLFICKAITDSLLKHNGFYKMLYIEWITNDISKYKYYCQQKKEANNNKLKKFNCKETMFNGLGLSQWKQIVAKKEKSLKNQLEKKKLTIDWKTIFIGYYRSSVFETIKFKMASISKICTSHNPTAYKLLLATCGYLKNTLQKLDNEDREYIIKRNYGKHIKKGHTLLHQLFYLLGTFQNLRENKEEMEKFIPYLNYLFFSCKENPIAMNNSWNLTIFHYVLRTGSYFLLHELSKAFFKELTSSPLLQYHPEPTRHPIIFYAIKYNIHKSIIKRWLQLNFVKEDLLFSKSDNGMNIIHYLMKRAIKNARSLTYLTMLKEVLQEEELTTLSNDKSTLNETPLSCSLSTLESLTNVLEINFLNRFYGIILYLCVDLKYNPSEEEIERWQKSVNIHSNSIAKYKLDLPTIELRRKCKADNWILFQQNK